VRALHPIDPAVPPHLAAFTELMSCVVDGTRKVRKSPGAVVVIPGAGREGSFSPSWSGRPARVVVAC